METRFIQVARSVAQVARSVALGARSVALGVRSVAPEARPVSLGARLAAAAPTPPMTPLRSHRTHLRRGRRPLRLTLAPGLLALIACSDTTTRGTWTVAVDTLPSGAVHVVNTPPATETDPAWTLEEVLRVGSIEGGGADTFGQLRGLVVLEDGSFAVLDATAQELRLFGPDGEHLATHGRKGAGPGELDSAYGLMVHPNGTLWVPDHGNARMSVFDPAEGFVASYPLPLFRRSFVWQGAMMEDGSVWKPSLVLGTDSNVMRVYGDSMVLADSLPMPADPDVDPEDPPGSFFWQSPDGNMGGYYGVPFFARAQQVIDPGGAVWSTAYGDPSYRIARWVPGGDTTVILEAARPFVPVPAAERDSAIAVVREALRGRGAARQDWSKVPSVRPQIRSMFVSASGELWVLSEREDGQLFDVYAPNGRHARTIANPLRLDRYVRPTVRGEELWAVVTDELEVHYVVRARVRPGAPEDGE